MVVKFFSFLLFFVSIFSYSQSEKTDSYLTQNDNETWLANFEKLEDKVLKRQALKKKLFSDSDYTGPRPGISLTGLDNKNREALRENNNEKPKPTADCKILFVLDSYVLDLNKNPKLKPLIENLDTVSIQSYTTLKDASATAIYGARARCGVVIITSKDDRITEALKELNQKTTKS